MKNIAIGIDYTRIPALLDLPLRPFVRTLRTDQQQTILIRVFGTALWASG